MRALVVFLAVAGSLTGAVVGVIAHHASSQSMGWTLYAPPPPRRHADYLPAAHTAWFPGIAEYVGIESAAGLTVAAALAALRFRLVRVP